MNFIDYIKILFLLLYIEIYSYISFLIILKYHFYYHYKRKYLYNLFIGFAINFNSINEPSFEIIVILLVYIFIINFILLTKIKSQFM